MSTKKDKLNVENETEVSPFKSDSLVQKALEILKETKRASTSAFQRRLKISYNRAAALMDHLESHDVIGPAKGSAPRDILVDLDSEWPEVPDLPENTKTTAKEKPSSESQADESSDDASDSEVPAGTDAEKPTGKPKPTVKSPIQRSFEFPLSDSELMKAGKGLVDTSRELEDLKDELDQAKAQNKLKREDVENRARHYRELISDEYEMRSVECEKSLDYEKEIRTIIRKDTLQEVECCPMSSDELSSLPL